jgi:hypothetical protein
MRATGEDGKKPTWLPQACWHSKRIVGRYRVNSPPFAVGKVRTSLCQMSVAVLPREKTKTVLFKVHAGRIFANRFEFDLKPDPVDSIYEL